MGTVLQLDGKRVVIYTDDHDPAHVHVMSAGSEVVLILDAPEGQLIERSSRGFSPREVAQIQRELRPHLKLLRKKWKELHD